MDGTGLVKAKKRAQELLEKNIVAFWKTNVRW
jgi:hypothetical protein